VIQNIAIMISGIKSISLMYFLGVTIIIYSGIQSGKMINED